jgi:hypothetical protein
VKKRLTAAGFLIILAVMGGSAVALSTTQDREVDRLKSFVPREVQGWKAEAQDAIYDPETIFEYIDGAGEVYRSYNFKSLLSRRFRREGDSEIIVDLFDMGSSGDAFGIFTHDLDGEEVRIGQGGNYKGGLLSFWKNRYFVSIFTEKETAETKDALLALGKSIAAAIDGEGAKPALLALLPAGFRDEKSIRYFHNHIILNYHFFVSEENILNLDQTTEAALAESGAKGQNGVLLLVRYSDLKRAADAQKNFTKYYMPDAQGLGLVRTEDNTWTSAAVLGNMVVVVFGAPTAESAKDVLARVQQGVRKSPDKDGKILLEE